MTTTMDIAKKYVDLCSKGQFDEVLKTLFARDAVSVEAAEMPGAPREARGLVAIEAKGSAWAENHTVHALNVEGPWPHGDRFVVRFGFDVTNKPSGQRIRMDEVGLFTVANGKIVREEFFYASEG